MRQGRKHLADNRRFRITCRGQRLSSILQNFSVEFELNPQLPRMPRRKEATGTSSQARQRRWWHLRQRWRMLGVFEINQNHEFYHLTSMIKEGMLASIQTSMDTASQDTLTPEHFKAVETQSHEGLEMQTFAGAVFSKLRRSLDISEEEYMNSLCSDGHYLQFVSNSKSKADFFVTCPQDCDSPASKDERINIRYDVKGCEVGRWTNPDTGGKQIIKVLKDNNFQGQSIALGGETSWFASQVKLDSAFLRELNVLDYSLLLAHQPLHQDELQGKHSLANLVIRTAKSLDWDESPTEATPPTLPLLGTNTDEGPTASGGCASGGSQAAAKSSSEEIPLQQMQGPTGENRTEVELQEFHQHHGRLLPNCKNAVHVIDGPERRYFVGVIDIFTVYNWRKKLENLWKSVRYPGRVFSTVSPAKYSHRFCQWIQEHTH
ncbi:phosphatidylinositol 4-phosphate 5-kinase-like protein 1 isoform X2 [Nelusetta ayraudi]|uniref:phosphatidylinositol 4-phosphate 5-kinase-like protein 1 isoform X2 n=1 Tax=Nelusetta ayraudi TaxID=303726 RepID=UPI003F703CD6